ncbi:MAG: Rpn family recombination-promoting nuclease/putative transposase [Solobacterium sp.]|nr:Rpn family recombination-promoting nuclease/putative transposase [Solobacterium sp.]
MKFKRFEELTISDNYMFSAVFSDPYLTAQLICRILPEEKLSPDEIIVKEKRIKTSYRSRSVIFDVYRKDDTHLFDIEMQIEDNMYLMDRAVYYGSSMIVDSHEAGSGYELKHRSYVIFICAFDATHTGKRMEHLILQNDGRTVSSDKMHVIFVNCPVEGEDNEQLRSFAQYVMNGKADEDDPFVQEVNTAVELKRGNRKEQELYMEWQYELDKAKAEGKAEGLEEGRLNALLSLYKKGRLDLNAVLEETGFTEEELKKALNEYLNDQ